MTFRDVVWCLLLGTSIACQAEPPGFEPNEPPILGACSISAGPSDIFADCVDEFAPAPGASFGHDAMPDVVLGAPVATGSPSTDVVSLGCGGMITLMFDGDGIHDGPGVDLVVFENPFALGDETFAEPARVLVSDDGVAWRAFPCEPQGAGVWPPAGCAGVTPTQEFDETRFDPNASGGDGFDLADMGLSQARYVRLRDVTFEHYGDDQWCAGPGGGFDLDAVAKVDH